MAAPARYREFRELLRYSPHAGTRIAHGQRCQCRLLENAAPQHLGRASSVTCCPTGRTKGACGPQAGYAAQSTITYGAARRAGTSEVCVTGGVDDVELDALPSHRSHLGHDGDACARTRRGGRQGMRTKTALKDKAIGVFCVYYLPRSRSRSRESMARSPPSSLSIFSLHASRSLSTSVVFPWST